MVRLTTCAVVLTAGMILPASALAQTSFYRAPESAPVAEDVSESLRVALAPARPRNLLFTAPRSSAAREESTGIRKGQLVVDLPLGLLSGHYFTSPKNSLDFGGAVSGFGGVGVGVGYVGYSWYFPSGKTESGEVPKRLLPFVGVNYYFAFSTKGDVSGITGGVLPSLGAMYRVNKDWSASASFPGFITISYWLK